MTNSTDVWVIIPNWNGAGLIVKCLQSLEAQTQSAKIVVVDNGSVDNSVQVIKNQFPSVKLIKLPKNVGFSGGVNAGISYALEQGAEFVALFNNDAVAKKDWLEQLVQAMLQNSKAGIATGKLLRTNSLYLDSTGQNYSIWGAPFPRGRNQTDTGQFDDKLIIFGASGGATLYRASMLKQIGQFDNRFFAYYEDDDISFRARLAGWEICYVPQSVAHHHISATTSGLGGFTRYHATKNIAMTYLKNMPGWLFWKYLPLFLLWMLRLAITSILKGGGLSYLRGIGRLLINMPGILIDRHRIQKNRKVSTKEIDNLLFRSWPPRVASVKTLE